MSGTIVARKNLNFTVNTFDLSEHTSEERNLIVDRINNVALERSSNAKKESSDVLFPLKMDNIIFPIHIPKRFGLDILEGVNQRISIDELPLSMLLLAIGGLRYKASIYSSSKIVSGVYNKDFIEATNMNYAPLIKGATQRSAPMNYSFNEEENNKYLDKSLNDKLAFAEVQQRQRKRRGDNIEEKPPQIKSLSSIEQLLPLVNKTLNTDIDGISVITMQLTITELFSLVYNLGCAFIHYTPGDVDEVNNTLSYTKGENKRFYDSFQNENLKKIIKDLLGLLQKDTKHPFNKIFKRIIYRSGRFTLPDWDYWMSSLTDIISTFEYSKERNNTKILDVSIVLLLDNFKVFTQDYQDIFQETFILTERNNVLSSYISPFLLSNRARLFDYSCRSGLFSEEEIYDRHKSKYSISLFPSSFSKVYFDKYLDELLEQGEKTLFSGANFIKVPESVSIEELNDQFIFVTKQEEYDKLLANLHLNLYSITPLNELYNPLFDRIHDVFSEDAVGKMGEHVISTYIGRFSVQDVIESIFPNSEVQIKVRNLIHKLIIGCDTELFIDNIMALYSLLKEQQSILSATVFSDKVLNYLFSSFFLGVVSSRKEVKLTIEKSNPKEAFALLRSGASLEKENGEVIQDLIKHHINYHGRDLIRFKGEATTFSRAFNGKTNEEIKQIIIESLDQFKLLIEDLSLFLSLPALMHTEIKSSRIIFIPVVRTFIEKKLKSSNIMEKIERKMYLTNESCNSVELGYMLFNLIGRFPDHNDKAAKLHNYLFELKKSNQTSYSIKEIIYNLFVNYL